MQRYDQCRRLEKKLAADHEARFAAELGRAVGRWDWWNLKAEHTPYQWQAQIAMYQVCPFGERRQDIRQAYHTAHLMAAASMAEVKNEEFNATIEHLSSYLKCDSQTEEDMFFDPEALKKVKEAKCQDSETT